MVSSAQTGEHAQGDYPEDVEPLSPHGRQRAVEREHEGSGEVERQQQRGFGRRGMRYTKSQPYRCGFLACDRRRRVRFIESRQHRA